ncbi:MAG: hypothetical protein Q8Q25_00345, partial [bacterium]|nr:hypothetical protein [bacterium]
MKDNKNENENNVIKKGESDQLESTFQELEQALKKQHQELQECQVFAQEWKEKFLKVSADFQNFKNRTEKERTSWAQMAQEAVLL